MSAGRTPARTVQLAEVSDTAIQRAAAMDMRGDPFAKLGEAPFWLVALADATGHGAEYLVLDLKTAATESRTR